MRLVDRILWLCLSLVLNACSLVAEFPDSPDGGGETGKQGDGGVSRPGAVCDDKSDCKSGELCCAGGTDGKLHCIASNGATECGACGSCDENLAPICGAKGCECEPGGGACRKGSVCDPQSRKCVVCRTNLDCGSSNGADVCVDHQCVDCARNNPDDPSDDEGCTNPKLPICSKDGVCVGCTPGGNDCPGGQMCVAGNGCLGCSVETTFPDNGCGSSTPACLPVNNGADFQCGKCTANSQCGANYCDEDHGTCHPTCDPRPASPDAGNGCPATNPMCKAGADGTYACQPCTAADTCPTGLVCGAPGSPNAGQCVPAASACMPGMTLVGGVCVAACTTNAQCAGNAAGPICTNGTCGRCAAGAAGDAQCRAANAATPFCSTAGACVACKVNQDCTAPLTPFCSAAGACVGCLVAGGTAVGGNSQCDNITRGRQPFCVTTGPYLGGCASCLPGATAVESTCRISGDAGYCYSAQPNQAPVCNQCVRESSAGTAGGCRPFNSCTLDADEGRYECTLDLTNPGNILGN